MRKQNITNYIFLLGLIILVLNDHIFKFEFHNAFTGKLSDFAGLLIFPMFLKFLFPINTKNSILITIIFFIFWKSPFSQFIIDFHNSLGIFHIARVIDYTDFIAFLILPFSYYTLENLEKFQIKVNNLYIKRSMSPVLLLLALLSFFSTTIDEDPIDLVQNCCNNNPTIDTVGLGNIFIPTMFTPDGDGINDYFQISVDSNIVRIDSFLVWNQVFGNTVFFEKHIKDIIPENGFDGFENDTTFATQYQYRIWVTSADSIKRNFDGIVCSIPCNNELNVDRPTQLDSCAFSTQYVPNEGYDKNLDSNEKLDCFN